jgi:hypothetical protein
MASSKDVLSVVGMLCVNQKFRADFFNNPEGKAEDLVGRLRADEMSQIQTLAGKRDLPAGKTHQQYVAEVTSAFEKVAMAIGCNCPSPPCPAPCPDSSELY